MKLMVAVPTTDYVHAEFTKCLGKLCAELARNGPQFDLEVVAGTSVHVARERIAFRAINEEFTHVLWLDSDMTFSPGIAEDLMWCGKDMVCGVFVSRRPPYQPCVYASIEKDDIRKIEGYGTQPFQVAGCGFAAVMTKTELLSAVHEKFGTCFEMTDMYYSEDLAFCKRVQELGREIWCDPSVRPGHIAHVPMYAGQALAGGAEA